MNFNDYQGGRVGGGVRIDWEFGIDMYILLYLKQIRLKRDFLIDIITNTWT